jgi:ribonuclease HI
MSVTIWTDGSYKPTLNAGGWGVVIEREGEERIGLCAGELGTTNNRMELTAAIEGLARCTQEEEITLYTDSQYVQRGITSWIRAWHANGWRASHGGPVKNADLWRRLDDLARARHITWRWVRGHNGDPGNERADALASAGAEVAAAVRPAQAARAV